MTEVTVIAKCSKNSRVKVQILSSVVSSDFIPQNLYVENGQSRTYSIYSHQYVVISEVEKDPQPNEGKQPELL